MQKTTKAVTVLICIASVILVCNTFAEASAPSIAWQKQYGGATEFLSNLIQTRDGGYAFLDLGWYHQGHFLASTFYKLDSAGEIEWTKKTSGFSALTVNQTSDEGYEVYGQWYPAGYYGPSNNYALLKLDSQGNIQWSLNYSTPDNLPTDLSLTQIPTSNGGYAYVNSSNLVVTDSNNQVIWSQPTTFKVETSLFSGVYDDYPFSLDSLVETSDGGVAGLGIGFAYSTSARGFICLLKTNAFLPLPTQEPLPTPVPTPTLTPAVPEKNWDKIMPWAATILVLAIGLSAVVFLRRRRKGQLEKTTKKTLICVW
jgi:hypothetical protein